MPIATVLRGALLNLITVYSFCITGILSIEDPDYCSFHGSHAWKITVQNSMGVYVDVIYGSSNCSSKYFAQFIAFYEECGFGKWFVFYKNIRLPTVLVFS